MTITYPPELLPSPDFDDEARVFVTCPKCNNMAQVIADHDQIRVRCLACGDVTAATARADKRK